MDVVRNTARIGAESHAQGVGGAREEQASSGVRAARRGAHHEASLAEIGVEWGAARDEAALDGGMPGDLDVDLADAATSEGAGRSSVAMDEDEIGLTGVTGAGAPLPFLDTIQASFGHHDVTGVRSHEGPEATQAAEQLGARAYAYGQDVAFGEPPDLHTAAHEAAHVIQQRRGVARKANGGPDTDLEAHADAVADVVVSGQSAEPLLDAPPSSGDHHAAVARKGNGKKKAPAPKRTDYTAHWEQIQSAAAGDAAAVAELDVEWMDGLPAFLLEQIDREFHAQKVQRDLDKAVAQNPQLRTINNNYKRSLAELSKDTKLRLQESGIKRPTKRDIEADEEYAQALAHIENERQTVIAAARADKESEFSTQKVKPGLEAAIVAPPKVGVTRNEGRALARTNFMAWGMNVLGSADAVKSHFSAIHEVPNGGGLWLHQSALTKYVEARSWFEARYPGYTFLKTSVGQSLRNRHQMMHSHGELGHPLGLSMDFDATVNVHQKDPVSQFMLRKFGAKENEDGSVTEGKNKLDVGGLPHSQVRALEATMDAGEELSASQQAFLARVEQAYDEMHATSERFRASMASQMPRLREAEQVWFEEGQPAAAKYLAAEKALAKKRAQFEKAYKKSHRGATPADTEAALAADPDISALTTDRDEALDAYEAVRLRVLTIVQECFAPWITQLQGEVDEKMARIDASALEAPIDVKDIGRLIASIERQRTRTGLVALLQKHQSVFPDIEPSTAPEDPKQLKTNMLERANLVKAAKWSSGEIAAREELIRRLSDDPVAVFGRGERVKGGQMRRKNVVDAPSVMQYLEKGFARNDEMNTASTGKGKQGAFNAEFIQCMMLHGFDTLAAWDTVDTMHFDYVRGLDVAKGNAKDTYGPVG